MLAGPVSALELGEIQVHSALGQPLRASVAFALQPNEQIHGYCIYVRPGAATSGLPGISNAAIAVNNGAIRVTGHTAIREPLLSLQLTVDCPHSAHLQREYSLFIDPGMPAGVQAAAPAAASADARVPPRATRTERSSSPARPAERAPIPSSTAYRVQPGDSLSGIASRISGRKVGIWQAVDAIFAANTEAFIGNDRDLLRAGALLAIPDSILSAAGTGTVRAAAVATQPGAMETAPGGQTGLRAGTSDDGANAAATPTTAPAATATDSRAGATAAAGSGEVILDADNPFVPPAVSPIDGDSSAAEPAGFTAPSEVIRPTAVEQAVSPRPAPVVRSSPAAGGASWTWLLWLGGSGVALILGLLLFGRRLKERFMPPYGTAAGIPARRRTDARSVEDTDVAPAPGLPSRGTAPVPHVVRLDADLEDGSGLQYGDVDVAQDFGFIDSGEFRHALDLDLTSAPAGPTTGFVPSRRIAEPSILVSETPPQREDTGEYDLSMIVDATQQILDESADTTKDLRAIEVDAEEDGNTVPKQYREVDYRILEQDYEDELTSTQALNAELAEAALELSKQFGKDEMGDTLADTTINAAVDEVMQGAMDDMAGMDDVTTLLPSAGGPLSGNEEAGDDKTAALPAAGGKAARTADDTSHLAVSSNMTLDDTANEEIALHVPAADNDAAIELDIEVDIESATIDTRKMRA